MRIPDAKSTNCIRNEQSPTYYLAIHYSAWQHKSFILKSDMCDQKYQYIEKINQIIYWWDQNLILEMQRDCNDYNEAN